MTDRDKDLEDRVSDLDNRLSALEDIFSPRILDRQTKHVKTQKEDARDYLQPGDQKRAVVKSPVGKGRDPNVCVGKIDGIVTFIEGVGMDDAKLNETLDVEVTRVQENCAYAVPEDEAYQT